MRRNNQQEHNRTNKEETNYEKDSSKGERKNIDCRYLHQGCGKNILGYSCTMIAEEYMKKNHPDTKEWGCEMDISSKRDENGNWNETWKISVYAVTKGLEFTDME